MAETRRSKYAKEHAIEEEQAIIEEEERERKEWDKAIHEATVKLKSMTNAELLNAVLEASAPDDYDGNWTDYGRCYFEIAVDLLKSRLGNWLEGK